MYLHVIWLNTANKKGVASEMFVTDHVIDFFIFPLNALQKEWLTLKGCFSFKHTSLTSPSCPPTLAGTAGTCCWQWALGIFWWLCCSSSHVLPFAEAWPLHEPRRCLTPSGHKQIHLLVSQHFHSGILLLLHFCYFTLFLLWMKRSSTSCRTWSKFLSMNLWTCIIEIAD